MSNQNIEEQLKKFKVAYKDLKEKLNIEIAKNQSLIEENNKLKGKNEELRKEIAKLKGEEFLSESTIIRQTNTKKAQLDDKKAEIELKFVLLNSDIDLVEKKSIEQSEFFRRIKIIRNEVQDMVSILQEQRQVEVSFFQNCEKLDKSIKNLSIIDQALIKVGNTLNKANQEVKKKIENYHRKIINSIKKIEENQDSIKLIEETLKELENNLKTYEEVTNKFKQIINDIETKNNNIEKLLSKTKKNISDFLKELNQKMLEKKKTPNPDDLLSSRLINKSRIMDIRNNDYFDKRNLDNLPSIIEESVALVPENINPDSFQESQLLKADWTEIAKLTDDGGQEVDINFTLIAVGLSQNIFYSSWSYGFDLFSDITILLTEMNGKKINTNFNDHCLTFKIKLYNGNRLPIHIKYKSIRKDINKYYNTNFVGLNSSMSGRHAKYTLLIPQQFVVVAFEKNIFVNRGNGKYSWTGVVPEGGLETQVKVSPKTGKWKINLFGGVKSNQNIKKTTFYTYKGFHKGNNKVIKYEVNSPNCNKIDGSIIKENGDNIEVLFENLNSNEGFLEQKITFENRSQGSWECDKEPNIPEDEKKNSKILKNLAEKIIKEDKNKIPDYVKIGQWVYKNIKYKLSYSGKKLTAIQILECKTGVCEHYTILYNALLNSINIPAIYCGGNAVNDLKSDDDDGAHAWSLIKVNGKWYPMDATWNIFSGNIPISHLFGHFGNGGYGAVGSDSVSFLKNKFSFECLNLN